MQKTKPKRARVFLGGVRKESRDGWLALCVEVVEAIGGLPPLDESHVYEGGKFEPFLRAIRFDEVAVLPCLIALDERPSEGGRPGKAFQSRLRRLQVKCCYIVDAEPDSALRSCDAKAWDAHADRVFNQVVNSRHLDPKKASEMALEKKKIHPGIVADFRSRARADDRKKVRVIWTSREYTNADEAIIAIGQEFEELKRMSRSTAERITGVGRNGKKKRARRVTSN